MHHLLVCYIIKMVPYNGCSQKLHILLKMEKSFIAHPWCLQSVVGLEEYSAHDWRAATSVQHAPLTCWEWGLWIKLVMKGIMDCKLTPNPILPEAGVLGSVTNICTSPSGPHDSSPINSQEGECPRIVRDKVKQQGERFSDANILSSFARLTPGLWESMALITTQAHKGEITGIQETRIKHGSDRREMVNSYSVLQGYTLYTISA